MTRVWVREPRRVSSIQKSRCSVWKRRSPPTLSLTSSLVSHRNETAFLLVEFSTSDRFNVVLSVFVDRFRQNERRRYPLRFRVRQLRCQFVGVDRRPLRRRGGRGGHGWQHWWRHPPRVAAHHPQLRTVEGPPAQYHHHRRQRRNLIYPPCFHSVNKKTLTSYQIRVQVLCLSRFIASALMGGGI